jgi:hypothetical protein
MPMKSRAPRFAAAVAVALVLAALPGCNRKPKETTTGSTDTIQSTSAPTTGTTATETGGGPPVSTSNTTGTAVTTDTSATTAGTAGATGTH